MGRKFSFPINAWAAGDTNQTTRDIIQKKLFGPIHEVGTGLIPGNLIDECRKKPGVQDALEIARIKHVSGGISYLTLKSYESGRESFQGTEQEVIWLDEEPPMSIYTECLVRTMTTDGLIMCTFTPLRGISEVVKLFMPEGRFTHERK
jgi:phage terminase large subunit-like protein